MVYYSFSHINHNKTIIKFIKSISAYHQNTSTAGLVCCVAGAFACLPAYTGHTFNYNPALR